MPMKPFLQSLKDRVERSWPSASLRTYLVAVLLLAILPIAAIMSWQIWRGERAEQVQVEDELARSAGAFAQSVERELNSSIEALTVLSQSELFQQARITALGRLLQGRPRRDWDSVFLLDTSGAVVLDTAPRGSATSVADLRALQREVMRRGKPVVSGLTRLEGPDAHGIALALPVMQGANLRYVLGVRMNDAVWQRLAADATRPQGTQANLSDAQNRLISDSGPTQPVGTTLPDDAAQAMAVEASGVQRTSDLEGNDVYAAWATVPTSGWHARVVRAAAPIDAAHRDAIVTALSTSGGGLLLGLLLAALVARRIARPLRRLATQGPAGLTGRIPVREIAALRDALERARVQDAQVHSALQATAEELRAKERLALAARHEAEAANRAKDEFLTMLSHELRNPLGAISAAVDVLESSDATSENAAEARAIIARQTRNLAHMMNDLLEVGRAIAGKITLTRHPVNVAAVVRRVEETLALTGESNEHPVHFELADAWIEGDAVRIEQVVTNLLTNAIKYTPAGRDIAVRVRRDADMAELEVRDAGMGIPASLLPQIFDLFVQGQRPLDRRAGGLGIGLTLVRSLVQLHHGTVSVESSEQGSRFTVRIPAIEAPQQVQDDTLPPSRRRQVLVVEDNDDVLAALRTKLELDGHTVTTAIDGVEGLSRLLKLRPEVSIIDIGLPGLTGFELARHARAAGYAGRMIALSGYGHERDAQEALVAGFDAYLVKPVDREQLRASLIAD
jgi:signal transduction histidine kinase